MSTTSDNILLPGENYSDCNYVESNTAELCTFWFEGVLLIVFGVFGIVGNVTSIFILSKLVAQSFFDSLLIALTSIDTIFIVFTVIDYSFARVFTWPWPEDSLVWVYLIPKFTYPLNNVCFCSSVFLTVMIALERYLAVCHPISYRQITLSSSNKQRLSLYLVPVILLSVILNIPKFFETVIISKPVSRNQENLTIENMEFGDVEYKTTVEISELRDNPAYTKYYTFLTRLLVTGIIPISALLYFNLNIYLGLKEAGKRLISTRRPVAQQNSAQLSVLERKKIATEPSLSLILLVIVAVFLICQLPRLVLNMAEFAGLESQTDKCGTNVEMLTWFGCLTGFSHLFLIFNASVNFLIYCSLNNAFKIELKRILNKIISQMTLQKKPTSVDFEMREL